MSNLHENYTWLMTKAFILVMAPWLQILEVNLKCLKLVHYKLLHGNPCELPREASTDLSVYTSFTSFMSIRCLISGQDVAEDFGRISHLLMLRNSSRQWCEWWIVWFAAHTRCGGWRVEVSNRGDISDEVHVLQVESEYRNFGFSGGYLYLCLECL